MSEISRAVRLAELLIAQRATVESLEAQLAAAKADLTRIEQEDLPDLMMELELKSFKMENGASVDIVADVTCGITEEKRAAAHAWLTEKGFGGLIKTDVIVTFGKGEQAAAQECAAAVGGTLKEAVHPATLKSFIKEQLAAGAPVPFDLFAVRPFNRVKIALKK